MISAQREHFVHKSKKVEHFGRTVLSTKICAKCQCAPKLEKREHRIGYEMRGNDTNRLTYVFQVLQWLTDLRDICLPSFLPRVILHSWNRCTAYPCRWFVFHLRTPWMENWRTGWWLKWLNAIWWWAFQFIQFIWATKRLLTLMPPERAKNSMSDEQKIRAISKSHQPLSPMPSASSEHGPLERTAFVEFLQLRYIYMKLLGNTQVHLASKSLCQSTFACFLFPVPPCGKICFRFESQVISNKNIPKGQKTRRGLSTYQSGKDHKGQEECGTTRSRTARATRKTNNIKSLILDPNFCFILILILILLLLMPPETIRIIGLYRSFQALSNCAIPWKQMESMCRYIPLNSAEAVLHHRSVQICNPWVWKRVSTGLGFASWRIPASALTLPTRISSMSALNICRYLRHNCKCTTCRL